jgi:hypothetical protein
VDDGKKCQKITQAFSFRNNAGKHLEPVLIMLLNKLINSDFLVNRKSKCLLSVEAVEIVIFMSDYFSGMRPKFEARGGSRVLQNRPNT